jgi:hypothetical protein
MMTVPFPIFNAVSIESVNRLRNSPASSFGFGVWDFGFRTTSRSTTASGKVAEGRKGVGLEQVN